MTDFAPQLSLWALPYQTLLTIVQASMSFDIPVSMKALIIEEVGLRYSGQRHRGVRLTVLFDSQRGRVAIKDHPVPDVADDDILIKTVTVSQNPTDWKRMSL